LPCSSSPVSADCTVGPDYAQPDTPLPQQYQGQVAVDRRQASTSTDPAAWWAGFGDPQLNHFVTLALVQNLDLTQATARVSQARAGTAAPSPWVKLIRQKAAGPRID